MAIHLLYTADYELYLGENHLPWEQVLIEPTERLLARCQGLGVPLTLFVDCLGLQQCRAWEEGFVLRAEAQLRRAAARGHDLEVHLHPHWPHTTRAGNRFLFPAESFLLGRAAASEAEVTELTVRLVRECRDYLEGLVADQDPGYRCCAFRAGAYGLQPRAGAVLAGIRQAGLGLDSSVIPGRVAGAMDFRGVPRRANYGLRDDLVTPVADGEGVWEVPIAAAHLDGLRFFPVRLARAWRGARALAWEPTPRGAPCFQPPPAVAPHWKQVYWRFRALLGQSFVFLELHRDDRVMVACVERYLEELGWDGGEVALAMVIHPKGVTDVHLEALERFHRAMARRHGEAYRPVTARAYWGIGARP